MDKIAVKKGLNLIINKMTCKNNQWKNIYYCKIALNILNMNKLKKRHKKREKKS